jgi:Inward rectifier potassium channel C-terminal domain
MIETREGYEPREKSHLGYKFPNISPITLEEVQQHIERTLSEIIVVVEGIDPQLSGTFQSIQSYKYEDIEFGADFQRCLFVQDNKFSVDLRLFHDVVFLDHLDDADPTGSAIVDSSKSKRTPEDALASVNFSSNGSEMLPTYKPLGTNKK